jgi:hypothetical protein
LAAFFVNQGIGQSSAGALAALVVGLIVAAISWAMVSQASGILRGRNLKLDRTATSLRRDVEAVKEKI